MACLHLPCTCGGQPKNPNRVLSPDKWMSYPTRVDQLPLASEDRHFFPCQASVSCSVSHDKTCPTLPDKPRCALSCRTSHAAPRKHDMSRLDSQGETSRAGSGMSPYPAPSCKTHCALHCHIANGSSCNAESSWSCGTSDVMRLPTRSPRRDKRSVGLLCPLGKERKPLNSTLR